MRSALVVVAVLIATLGLEASLVPTFDFDEALYRRIAEEMRRSHEYFVPTWDGRPFYEKPPTYIWSIAAASAWIDRGDSHVSVFASRFPSLLCSLLTIALLAWFWRRVGPDVAKLFGVPIDGSRRWLLSPLLPVVAYGSGLFAIGGASGVVLDPMLTLFLLAPMLAFTGALLRCERADVKLTRHELVLSSLGMAAATTVKGFIGVVLPAIAIVLHLAITRVTWSSRLIRQLYLMFGSAILAAAAFFAEFYQFTGSGFVYEFFIRQHFVRATKPMQGHSGSLLFHFAVVMFLGGPLVAFVIRSLARRGRVPFARWGFPLTWTISVILFYSAIATKLPNYTWPVWPALVIALCVLLVRNCEVAGRTAARSVRIALTTAAFACVIPVAVVFIALGSGAESRWHLPVASRAAVMLQSIGPVPLPMRLGMLLAGLAVGMQLVGIAAFARRVDSSSQPLWRPIARASVLNCFALAALSLLVLPVADRLLRGPLVRLSRDASAENRSGGRSDDGRPVQSDRQLELRRRRDPADRTARPMGRPFAGPASSPRARVAYCGVRPGRVQGDPERRVSDTLRERKRHGFRSCG